MSALRITLIDRSRSISFVAPAHAAKVFTAACSQNPADLDQLLQSARRFDTELIDLILDGLCLFDHHNQGGNYTAIQQILASVPPQETPPVRVVNDVTRAVSLAPVGAGLILYNLKARRIVQVQNSYSSLLRRDRGRIRASGHPTRHIYRYELPTEWQLVP